MPYSDATFDDLTDTFVRQIQLSRCLDIGAGEGKYGKLVREFHPHVEIIGIEIESEYVERFELDKIYDSIWCMPANAIIDEKVDVNYDLVIIGDCLEHLRKSQGIDLLNFLIYRTRYLLIVYPERYLQGSWEGYLHEAHISFWGENDFAGLDYILFRRNSRVAVLVNGYLLNTELEPSVQKLVGKDA